MAEESYRLKVIGHMRSPFLYKNGTPRQPIICPYVTGEITIEKNVFNNPDHSLEGLEQFSHVWILFIFHKNNNVHSKAKVKPPRMNGKKTGVFSTRSPYRPNNIGLTLAKIESVKGSTVTVSGIDIIDGTPIIDLKPYIPIYDNSVLMSHELEEVKSEPEKVTDCMINHKETKIKDGKEKGINLDNLNQVNKDGIEKGIDLDNLDLVNKEIETDLSNDTVESHDRESESLKGACDTFKNIHQLENPCINRGKDQEFSCVALEDNESNDLIQIENIQDVSVTLKPRQKRQNLDMKVSDTNISTADWISNSPVSSLEVRFTPSAEEQLKLFNSETDDADFKFQFLKSFSQAKQSVCDILHQDPRSSYRRKHCQDSLYYFTLDILHITCWFDVNLVEIVRIKPVGKVDRLNN